MNGEARFGEIELGCLAQSRQHSRCAVSLGWLGKCDRIAPTNKRAGLYELRRLERGEAHEQAWAVGEAVGDGIGLVFERRHDGEEAFADLDLVADLELQALEENGVGHNAVRGIDGVTKISAAAEQDRALERISAIDSLDLDEALILTVGRAGHGAQGRRFAHDALVFEPDALRPFGASMHARKRDIAAEDHLALIFEASA